jgi:hypothetical protein
MRASGSKLTGKFTGKLFGDKLDGLENAWRLEHKAVPFFWTQ